MEFVKLKPINRICPYCGNGNYMRIISGKNVGELNVKCINCNSYYNYDELLKRGNSIPLNGADGRTMDDLCGEGTAMHRESGNFRHDEGTVSHFYKVPTAENTPVRHGYWYVYPDVCVCSVCGEQSPGLFKDCPNCGASMDGQAEEMWE